MNKPLFYISCPFDTYSGYGARARDIVKAIIELDKYEVKLLSQKWIKLYSHKKRGENLSSKVWFWRLYKNLYVYI